MDPLDPLILDLLESLRAGPRAYDEVMRAWRTSCPRLPVWEEATERGLLSRRRDPERGPVVALSPRGRAFLASAR